MSFFFSVLSLSGSLGRVGISLIPFESLFWTLGKLAYLGLRKSYPWINILITVCPGNSHINKIFGQGNIFYIHGFFSLKIYYAGCIQNYELQFIQLL